MKCVLYTEDLEPITILDLPPHAIRLGQNLGRIWLAVMEPFKPGPHGFLPPMDAEIKRRTVSVQFEQLKRNGQLHWILTTRDEELALMLTPAWLPGQQGRINGYERTIRMLTQALVSSIERGGRM